MRALLSLLLSFCLTAKATDRPLASAAADFAKKLQAGGIVTGESVDGKISFAGFASAQDNRKDYHEKVLFEIGSITKVFTGLLLAQAVLEGKVTLDTPVSQWLGEDVKFADPRVGAITLKQLSTHTSGLPRLPGNHMMGIKEGDPYAAYDEKLLKAFLSTTHLKGDGPFPCSYSNLGVGLLGHLLGKVYNSTWEEAVISRICKPLGLDATRMTITGSKLPLAPPHHGKKEASSWHFDTIAGAGGLRSTATDLLKFGQAMAKPESTPLAAAFALAMKPHAENPGSGQIGLGPFISKRDGVVTYDHDGGTGGYRSGLQVIPEKNIVRVVLINNTQLDGGAIIAATRVPGPRKLPQEVTLDAATLQEYPGVYALDNETRFTVLLREGAVWIRLTGQAFLRAFPSGKDRLFYKSVDAEIQFVRTEGKITSLTLFQNGRELNAKRTDQPEPGIILHQPSELKPYTGKFLILGLKPFDISLRGNTLYARLEGQDALPVFDMGEDRFEYDAVEASLTFTRDDKGAVVGLTLLQNGLPVAAVREKK